MTRSRTSGDLTHFIGENGDDSLKSAGLAPFVIQEEFSRYSGFQWSPISLPNGQHAIIYEVLDNTGVDQINIPDFSNLTECEQHRYPFAGRKNGAVELQVAEFTVDSQVSLGGCTLDVAFNAHSTSCALGHSQCGYKAFTTTSFNSLRLARIHCSIRMDSFSRLCTDSPIEIRCHNRT